MFDSRSIRFFILLLTLNKYCFALSSSEVHCSPGCDKYITNEGMEICACAGTFQRHHVMPIDQATVCRRGGCEARLDRDGEVVCVCVSGTIASSTECKRGCLSYEDEDGRLGCDCSKPQEDCRKRSCKWGFECQRLKEDCRIFQRGVSCVERWKCIRSSYQRKSESLEIKGMQDGGEKNMEQPLDSSRADCSYELCRYCQSKVTKREGKYFCENCQCQIELSAILQQKRSIDIVTKPSPPPTIISIDMKRFPTAIPPTGLLATETTTGIPLPNTAIEDTHTPLTSTTIEMTTTTMIFPTTTTTNPPLLPTTVEAIVPTTTTLTTTDEKQEEDIDGIVSTFFDD